MKNISWQTRKSKAGGSWLIMATYQSLNSCGGVAEISRNKSNRKPAAKYQRKHQRISEIMAAIGSVSWRQRQYVAMK